MGEDTISRKLEEFILKLFFEKLSLNSQSINQGTKKNKTESVICHNEVAANVFLLNYFT